MLTIWKYPLAMTSEQTVRMPKGAHVLAVQFQKGVVCLWALVESDAPQEDRTVYVCGTGHTITADIGPMDHIDTFQMLDGDLVWHVFVERIWT